LIYVGIDWAEAHHDVHILDEAGESLGHAHVSEGIDGLRRIHELVRKHTDDAGTVVIGIETDRGLLVQGLVAAGYVVYALNPFSASQYRNRHTVSRAKSDPADAKLLADIVRTDRHNHRVIAGDSELAGAIKVLARAHKTLVWNRQREASRLRSTLREYYPGALDVFRNDLTHGDALAVLERAPTPQVGRRLSLSSLRALLKRGGRQRYIDARTKAIQRALRTPQLEQSVTLSRAYASVVRAGVRSIRHLNAEIAQLETEMADTTEQHPDAEILRSLPGLGPILGPRVLGEFGDDRTRYQDAKARRNYAGSSPITKASGTKKVVMARFVRNDRLSDAVQLWAFGAVNASPGARQYYDVRRRRGQSHSQALRAVGNRLVGILHGCIVHHTHYAEAVAWGPVPETVAVA
jgi:transposase